MTVDVDRKPFASRMRRPRETPRDFRARRQTFEQHFAPSFVVSAHLSAGAHLF